MREVEKEFFSNDPELSQIPQSNKGIPSLINILTRIQNERIQAVLPKIKRRIHEAIDEKNSELRLIGKEISTSQEASERF